MSNLMVMSSAQKSTNGHRIKISARIAGVSFSSQILEFIERIFTFFLGKEISMQAALGTPLNLQSNAF